LPLGCVAAATLKTVSSRILSILGRRWWPVALTVLAIAVSLPALQAGLLNDDYCHRSALLGPSEFLDRLGPAGLAPGGSGRLGTALSEQFVAVAPNANLRRLKAYGALPWWTCDDLRVAFWRPVSSFTHWLDYRLFPNTLPLMHLHSILWFAAAVLAVSLLYRRLIGVAWVATLGALLYVLADFSYFPTLWLANRNALLALFFGLLALILHDRYRRRGGGYGLVAAAACLLLSVLSAEAGVATFAYLLAYEAVLRRERWAVRLRALVPFVVVIVGWRLIYNVLGYGADGGGFYLDPVREPVRYALAVFDRAPFFLGGQWLTVPPDLYAIFSGVSKQLLWGTLALFTVAIPAAVWPLLRADRRARFWLTGMYLSVLPVCATVPMSRALIFIAVGAFGLTAEFVGGWQRKADWVPKRGWQRVLVAVLVVATLTAHLPWAAVKRVTAPFVTTSAERQMTRTMVIGTRQWSHREDLVVVNAPNPAAFLYDPFRNACEGKTLPGAVRALAPAFGALEVLRTRPRRLVVRAVSRSLLDGPRHHGLHFVFFYQTLSAVRGPDRPMQVGQRIVLPRLEVEVLRVDEHGLPVEAAFTFPVPLEDASLRWLYWDWPHRRYAAFHVPEVGATVVLAGPFPQEGVGDAETPVRP
jgi:hypothetical protein